jgi:hypothetical protein
MGEDGAFALRMQNRKLGPCLATINRILLSAMVNVCPFISAAGASPFCPSVICLFCLDVRLLFSRAATYRKMSPHLSQNILPV